MAHVYISAAHKSSGKTTLTLGLCRALRDQGQTVRAFKKGPDYIDPIWHRLASGCSSYNLDFHMMSHDAVRDSFARQMQGVSMALVEGNKGLYDGMDAEGTDSNAALAKLLRAPVVLVLDTQGMTRGVAPLLLGYQQFDAEVQIAGVIFNKVGGARHEAKLRAAVARYTEIPVLGAVRMDAELAIAERHLGLMPGNESAEAEQRIVAIARRVTEQVDLAALCEVAARAPWPQPCAPAQPPLAGVEGLRLAWWYDRAFGFYYQDDLDLLRASGVQLLPVDSLSDARLPDCDGVLIGGGFPELFIAELSANRALRQHLRQAIEQGLPAYAECGGLMYLARSLTWGAVSGEMVGVVPGDAVMGERPVGRGYAVLQETAHAPWPPATAPVPAHEFHYSRLENLPADLNYAYRVLRGHGIAEGRDGIVYKNVLASYCHRRGSGPHGWIGPFLAKVQGYRQQRDAARMAA